MHCLHAKIYISFAFRIVFDMFPIIVFLVIYYNVNLYWVKCSLFLRWRSIIEYKTNLPFEGMKWLRTVLDLTWYLFDSGILSHQNTTSTQLLQSLHNRLCFKRFVLPSWNKWSGSSGVFYPRKIHFIYRSTEPELKAYSLENI